jgi:alkylation response protein AidB-like acyl-CoA dehydrogenase
VDFSFTDEQQMLLDSTRRFVADHYGLEQRRQIAASTDGFSREAWQQFAELGLLALNIPEQDGGLEAGPIGTLLVSMALGEALVVEPYLSSAVLATRAISQLGSPQQRSEWLPRLAAGEWIIVLAHEEGASRHEATAIDTHATHTENGWVLNGCKSVVYHAPMADLLLISAQIDGPDDQEVGVFAIPRDFAGVTLHTYTTVDGQRAADVKLEKAEVPASARMGGNVGVQLQAVLDYGLTALCAEALGALDKLLSTTIEYSRTRVQFGVPIGRFQALQHRMADMLTHLELARSMAYLAASRCTGDDPVERAATLSAAKVIVGQAARFIGQQAVQLHGGMGVTDELSVSHYFKRLLAVELRFGSTDFHLERYARNL